VPGIEAEIEQPLVVNYIALASPARRSFPVLQLSHFKPCVMFFYSEAVLKNETFKKSIRVFGYHIRT
jgi:hypothetical protein